MGMVYKHGQMVQNTKAIGKIIKHMDTVCFGMLMAINMRVGGNETCPTVLVSIFIVMVLLMKVNGKMIYNMVKV